MDRIEVFQILGIEETKDEGHIKNAYREKLSVTNPEDDPEGFKRLRSAYEEACRLAKENDEKQEGQTGDTTPSGLWVEKAANIYNNIHTRQDLSLWEELFRDDCFLSLEDEENCRFKLLRFLMEHFKLPTDVWKLLDKKLSIVSDAAKLRERFPADFVRYILNKCERGEDVEFSQFEGPEDGAYDLFLQYYDRTLQAFSEEKPEEAAQCIENADRLGISHPVMEICRGNLLLRQGRSSEAVALMEKLLAKYPEDAMVSYNTAEMLWKQEHAENDRFRDRAAEIYQKLKEENDSHYMANVRLTEWYCEKGQYKDAKTCAEKVLFSGSDEAFMKLLRKVNAQIELELEKEYRETKKWEPALELCWCYLQDGKIAKGIMLAVSIEKQLPPEKEAEYNGLLAKLYVEEAEYEDSVIMTHAWEAALRKRLESDEPEEEKEKDRDRLQQTHLIRMQCYHNLGFKDKAQFAEAVKEGKSVLTGGIKDIGILLEMAQIYTEMGEYEQCLELVRRLVDEYQIFAAYATSLEAYRRQLDAAGVVKSSTQCIRYFPGFVKAYEYVAKVYLDLNYAENLEKVLEDAEKNGVKSAILDAYRYQLHKRLVNKKTMELSILNHKLIQFRAKYRERVEKGELFLYEEGLKLLTEYLYNCPDSYMFVERALFHRAAHHYEEAREDFEKALSLNPSNPYALNGLSLTYKYMGELEKALVCVKKAILYRDEEISPAIYSDMGHLYSLLGDHLRALAAYTQYEKLAEGKQRSLRSLEELAECKMRMGQVEAADAMYRRLYERDIWKCYELRTNLFIRTGNEQRARELLKEWSRKLKLEKNDPFSRYFRRINHSESKKYYKGYFTYAAWAELIFGTKEAALKRFDDAITYNLDPDCEQSLLYDAVFCCIACGDDKRGKKYSERLQIWLNRESFKAVDQYYNSAKNKWNIKLLSCFYTESPEKLRELLEQAAVTETCYSCTNPYCKELEAIRILFFVRQGNRREALGRLTQNLEKFPQDEYSLAIKHTVFGDRL